MMTASNKIDIPLKSKPLTFMQARSLERRERLIAATLSLLDTLSLEEITLAVVSNRAGIPYSSTCYLYPKTNYLLAAVIERLHDQYLVMLREPYLRGTSKHWQTIIGEIIDRKTAFYNQRPDARQLMLSDKSPPEIKHAERLADHSIGLAMIAAISKYYELPSFPERENVFFYSAKILSLFFTLSNIQHNKITLNFNQEAKWATINYLNAHLPFDLKPAKSHKR
jgi:AcrR family transcriptional regulator